MVADTAGAGTVIAGKYELCELAGEGGMATVWRGITGEGSTRSVAVKRLRPEFRAIKSYVDMFVEEARVGSELDHPNIVQVIDFCRAADGLYYLVMEWVDGMDLGGLARLAAQIGAPLEWPAVTSIGIGVLRGLGAAHERRRADGTPAPVVHRDVSPQNILIAADGAVKLSDFGLARARDRLMSFTAPGSVKGKLHYFPPEVTLGKPASPQSDLFSLSVVIWEVLAGTRLFTGANEVEVLTRIRNGAPRELGRLRPDLSPRLVAAVHRGLSVQPSNRFVSARQMAVELGECLREHGEPLDQRATIARRVTGVRESARAQGHALSPSELDQPTWSITTPADDAPDRQ